MYCTYVTTELYSVEVTLGNICYCGDYDKVNRYLYLLFQHNYFSYAFKYLFSKLCQHNICQAYLVAIMMGIITSCSDNYNSQQIDAYMNQQTSYSQCLYTNGIVRVDDLAISVMCNTSIEL